MNLVQGVPTSFDKMVKCLTFVLLFVGESQVDMRGLGVAVPVRKYDPDLPWFAVGDVSAELDCRKHRGKHVPNVRTKPVQRLSIGAIRPIFEYEDEYCLRKSLYQSLHPGQDCWVIQNPADVVVGHVCHWDLKYRVAIVIQMTGPSLWHALLMDVLDVLPRGHNACIVLQHDLTEDLELVPTSIETESHRA